MDFAARVYIHALVGHRATAGFMAEAGPPALLAAARQRAGRVLERADHDVVLLHGRAAKVAHRLGRHIAEQRALGRATGKDVLGHRAIMEHRLAVALARDKADVVIDRVGGRVQVHVLAAIVDDAAVGVRGPSSADELGLPWPSRPPMPTISPCRPAARYRAPSERAPAPAPRAPDPLAGPRTARCGSPQRPRAAARSCDRRSHPASRRC